MLNGVDGIRACLGIHLGHSDWFEVDLATIGRFDALTDDASERGFDKSDSAVVPEGVVLALMIPLIQQIYVLENAQGVALHRIEQVQFLSAAPIGSGVRIGATVKGMQPVGDRWQIRLECAMECDTTTEPILRADVLYRFRTSIAPAMPSLSLYKSNFSCR